MKTKRSDVVSAWQIAAWVFCPESWRLEAIGEEPENQWRSPGGRHFTNARPQRMSGHAARRRLGWGLLVLTLILTALWFAFPVGEG